MRGRDSWASGVNEAAASPVAVLPIVRRLPLVAAPPLGPQRAICLHHWFPSLKAELVASQGKAGTSHFSLSGTLLLCAEDSLLKLKKKRFGEGREGVFRVTLQSQAHREPDRRLLVGEMSAPQLQRKPWAPVPRDHPVN